jgi:O-antigen ligase
VILTKSRGGFIALAVVSLVTLVKVPSRIPFLRTGLTLSAILIFSLVAPPTYWQRISTIWGGEDLKTAADGYLRGGFETARWQIWKNGLILIASHPILGVGAGAFTVAEGSLHKGGKWNAPHSSFIQITAELGIGGLVIFLFLIYRGFANCRTVIRATRQTPSMARYYWIAHGLEASLCGYVVAGSALTQAYSDIFYFLLAMSIVLVRLTTSRTTRATRDLDVRGGARGGPWWKQSA